MRWFAGILLLFLISACAEQSTMPPPGAKAVIKTYPAHDSKVRLVKSDLPPGTRYEVLGKVKAIEDSYGPRSEAETRLAELARKIGADAVINERAWYAPRVLAWAAPHAEGTAVKVLSPPKLDLDTVAGEWY